MKGRRINPACVILLLAARVTAAETTERVSVDSSGIEGDDDCKWSDISADGRYVTFDSFADNLVASDSNHAVDVFVFDRQAGTTTLVSVSSGGAQGDAGSDYPSISADGRYVAFSSDATNLVSGDLNGRTDIFVRDLQSGTTERVSVDAAGGEGDRPAGRASVTSDGRYVTFNSFATNLVPGDTNSASDVFVFDRQTGTLERVSVDSTGGEADDGSFITTISGDGRYVAFTSDATNLVSGDSNGLRDVFVHDGQQRTTIRVSVSSSGAEGLHGRADSSRISEDGRFVAFYSAADNLVPGDTNMTGDIFVHDLQTSTTEVINVNSAGGFSTKTSLHPRISSDGRYVEFESLANDLVANDTNSTSDVFLRDRQLGMTQRVSIDSSGAQSNGFSHSGSLALDGSYVTFYSDATNLVAGDTNGANDIFVHHVCLPASWSNYGTGFPGTLGVPSLTAQGDPVLGATLDVDVGNSTSTSTLAYLLVGYSEAATPLRKGGELLVIPVFTIVIALPPSGTTVSEDIEDDEALCGLEFFAQTFLLDAGAAKGQATSAGLKLILGR